MKFLSDKADSLTLYSENGKMTQMEGGKISFMNGRLEVSAQTAPLCFLRRAGRHMHFCANGMRFFPFGARRYFTTNLA